MVEGFTLVFGTTSEFEILTAKFLLRQRDSLWGFRLDKFQNRVDLEQNLQISIFQFWHCKMIFWYVLVLVMRLHWTILPTKWCCALSFSAQSSLVWSKINVWFSKCLKKLVLCQCRKNHDWDQKPFNIFQKQISSSCSRKNERYCKTNSLQVFMTSHNRF